MNYQDTHMFANSVYELERQYDAEQKQKRKEAERDNAMFTAVAESKKHTELLTEQVAELKAQNAELERQAAKSNRSAKRSHRISIISLAVAVVSLIASVLIGVLV